MLCNSSLNRENEASLLPHKYLIVSHITLVSVVRSSGAQAALGYEYINPSQSHVSQKWNSWGDNQRIPWKQRQGCKGTRARGSSKRVGPGRLLFLLLQLSSLSVLTLLWGLAYFPHFSQVVTQGRKHGHKHLQLSSSRGRRQHLPPAVPVDPRKELWLDQEDGARSGSCNHTWIRSRWQLMWHTLYHQKKGHGEPYWENQKPTKTSIGAVRVFWCRVWGDTRVCVHMSTE